MTPVNSMVTIADTLVKLATLGAIVYGWKIFIGYWTARLEYLGLESTKFMGVEKKVE